MSDTRYYAETQCEHGLIQAHGSPAETQFKGRIDCPGGARRELTIDYAAAVRRGIEVTGDIDGVSMGDWRSIVDAALSGETGDTDG